MDTITVYNTLPYGFREEAEALLQDHWGEVARNKDLMELAPDWARYEALDDAGVLLFLTARKEGRLVGYSCNIVGTHLHYRHLTVASNDVLYLAPGARGTLGLRLIRRTEEEAERAGAKLMLWHAKPDSTLDRLLQAKGYGVQDIIYTRPLEEALWDGQQSTLSAPQSAREQP